MTKAKAMKGRDGSGDGECDGSLTPGGRLQERRMVAEVAGVAGVVEMATDASEKSNDDSETASRTNQTQQSCTQCSWHGR